MLEFLILLPLIMVSILSMTFEVSVDELSNVSRGNYFSYDTSKKDVGSFREKVHQFYSRMLEDSENEIEGTNNRNSKRPKGGQTCDIQAVQSMNRKCSCNKPRKTCVHINHDEDNVIFTMPQCVLLERCEGICPFNWRCKPTTKETMQIPVIYVNRIVTNFGEEIVIPECSTVTVEKHLKCTCSCKQTEEDCISKQVFNPSTCKCECQKTSAAEDCKKTGKEWDAVNCDCICPSHIPQICSTGAFFSHELCRCIPIDNASGGRRRRPPV